MRRNKKGQFKSKRDAELEDKIRLYGTLTLLTIALMFGFATKSWTIVIENVHAKELGEVNTVIEPTPVDRAILAIETALGKKVKEETKRRVAYLYEQAPQDIFYDAVKTIYCESMWMSQQSMIWDKYGQQEPSYGLVQIYLPAHPDVTKAQALDAYFSIDWMIEHWNYAIWYGYDRETGQCTNSLTITL